MKIRHYHLSSTKGVFGSFGTILLLLLVAGNHPTRATTSRRLRGNGGNIAAIQEDNQHDGGRSLMTTQGEVMMKPTGIPNPMYKYTFNEASSMAETTGTTMTFRNEGVGDTFGLTVHGTYNQGFHHTKDGQLVLDPIQAKQAGKSPAYLSIPMDAIKENMSGSVEMRLTVHSYGAANNLWFRAFDFGLTNGNMGERYWMLALSEGGNPNTQVYEYTANTWYDRQTMKSSHVINVNQEYHIVATFESRGSSGYTMAWYLNGQLAEKRDVNDPNLLSLQDLDGEGYFGRSHFPADGYMSGKFNDITLYNSALTAANVKELYTLGVKKQRLGESCNGGDVCPTGWGYCTPHQQVCAWPITQYEKSQKIKMVAKNACSEPHTKSYHLRDEKRPVSCCYTDPITGVTTGDRGTCSFEVTYDEAVKFCEDMNMGLCEKQDVHIACGTGICSNTNDNDRVWTSTEMQATFVTSADKRMSASVVESLFNTCSQGSLAYLDYHPNSDPAWVNVPQADLGHLLICDGTTSVPQKTFHSTNPDNRSYLDLTLYEFEIPTKEKLFIACKSGDASCEMSDGGYCLLDADKDGTPDCIDSCPNDPTKTTDIDSDGDNVLDCNDSCPFDARWHTPQDNDGGKTHKTDVIVTTGFYFHPMYSTVFCFVGLLVDQKRWCR